MNSFERAINKFRIAMSLPSISIDGKDGQARATFIADAGPVTVESSIHFEGDPFYITPDDLKTIKRIDNLRLIENGVFYGDLEVKIKVDSESAPMVALEYEPGDFEVKKNDLEYVMLAASTDKARPVLNTVLFTSSRLAATDGYRLHLVPGTYHNEDNLTAILPVEALRRIKSDFAIVHKDDHSIITFNDRDNRVIMKVPWVVGTFPDFTKIIPEKTKVNFLLPNDKRFKKVSGDKYGMITLNDNLRFETWNGDSDTRTMFETMPEFINKPDNEIKFGISPKFLCDAIRDDPVKIGINSYNVPIVIGDSVVMPQHLAD